MRNILKSERGSVMLEFCLVLPIYLLIFGGTFLLFDLSMARLHLQEANRNIAWIQDDRHGGALINQELYRRCAAYFETRNALEQGMCGQPMWSFGEEYKNYQSDLADDNASLNPDFWGDGLMEFKANGEKLSVNNSWADKIGGLLPNDWGNDFMKIHYGNMELTMDKVSATYIGAVGVSSVLFPAPDASGQETVPLYDSRYILTRARNDDGTATAETRKEREERQKQERTKNSYPVKTIVNGEMFVVRRTRDGNEREDARTVNDLTPLGLGGQNILFRSWPSNGLLGDIGVLLGVGL